MPPVTRASTLSEHCSSHANEPYGGDGRACKVHHQRLLTLIDGGGSRARVMAVLMSQNEARRRWHAADIIALLADHDACAVALVEMEGLQSAGSRVHVGWRGYRRVRPDWKAVHVSPNGQGAAGPTMLWAGLDARGK